jgi:hypothetical protein
MDICYLNFQLIITEFKFLLCKIGSFKKLVTVQQVFQSLIRMHPAYGVDEISQ